MPFRNIPTDAAAPLAQLIDTHSGQVSSMALTRNAGFDLTLLAFAPGESVSEEEYFEIRYITCSKARRAWCCPMRG